METGELFLGSDFRRPAADFFSGLRAQLQADNFSGFCELSDNAYFPLPHRWAAKPTKPISQGKNPIQPNIRNIIGRC
jgi:hypothetical protein